MLCSTVFAKPRVELPQKLRNFIKKLELQKDELQGGAIAILYKGEVIYKTTFGNQKGNSGVVTDKTLLIYQHFSGQLFKRNFVSLHILLVINNR